MRRAVVLAVLAAAIAAPSAGATIVPGRSIAGVALGMTKAQVRATLGTPVVQHGSNEFGSFAVFRYFRLRVTFQGNANVTNVRTTRRRERTVRGIGVGSTRTEVLARVRDVRCQRGLCIKGRLRAGRRVTVFRLFNARVTSVEVGFVID